MRIYGGDLAFSGAAILGQPFPSLGHSRYLSIAMTTGGPDTSDIYEEEVQDGKYKFKDEWRPLEVRTERIARQGRRRDEVPGRAHRIHAPRPDRGAQERQGLLRRDSVRQRIPPDRNRVEGGHRAQSGAGQDRRSADCSTWRRTS